MTEHIQSEIKGGVGHITLNRPEALNALTLDMIEALDACITDYAEDGNVKMVLVTSASEKAFCAGGDVKAVAVASKAHNDGASVGETLFSTLFRKEYELNTKIHNFEKPYVSIIGGLCMGGGVGISAHGSHRILTKNASFAMPEVKIGFFPDVGVAHLLSNMKTGMGEYLGLTGARINADDMMYLGLGTHMIDEEGVSHLIENLTSLDWSRADTNSLLNSTLVNYCENYAGASDLEARASNVVAQFSKGALSDILPVLDNLEALCPLSLKITFDHIKNAKGKALEEVIVKDYRLSQFFMRHPDFYEGVRALLIDKDNAPKWTSSFDAIGDDIYTQAINAFEGEDLDV